MATMKEAYEEKIKAQLEEWKSQIALLKAKGESAKADAKVEYAEELEQLRAKQAHAEAKLEELRQAGDSAWEDIKAGVEKAWDDLGDALESAKKRF